jgi:hypothetical protein
MALRLSQQNALLNGNPEQGSHIKEAAGIELVDAGREVFWGIHDVRSANSRAENQRKGLRTFSILRETDGETASTASTIAEPFFFDFRSLFIAISIPRNNCILLLIMTFLPEVLLG